MLQKIILQINEIELSICQRILKKLSMTVFTIDNNHKCVLIIRSSY